MCLLLGLGAQVGQGERPGCLELKGRNRGTQNKACSHGPGLHLRLLLQALLTLRSVGCLWLPPTAYSAFLDFAMALPCDQVSAPMSPPCQPPLYLPLYFTT